MENKITFYRNKLDITQEKLAQLAGVTRQTIIALEQNRYNPSLALAYKITQALEQKNIEDVFVFS
ncbi:MAG: helix-turn-helix transcriptional regulator [Candidatus Paceibacterota bacterium]|jgi:putative transcriptional regulator